MKTAFSTWDNRIAPVFEVAPLIHVVESKSGRMVTEASESMAEGTAVQKALRLAELKIGTLVCGAICRPTEDMIAAYGIRVVPFVAGDLREVIDAWLHGKMDVAHFAMPGCFGGGRRRFRGMRGFGRGVGVSGYCVCPQCGHRQPHERGVPCGQTQCPKCGANLTRA